MQKKGDDEQVRVSCKIDKGWPDDVPEVRAHLIYSHKFGLPRSSQYNYKSKKRETHVRTEARWLSKPAKTTVEATKVKKRKL
ncbi:MAG: hypothetical protein ACYTGW_14950 [Planctomycetota bacterium]